MITSVSLAGNWGKEVLGDQGSKTATQWALLGAASFVVMGTTSALYKDYQCGDIESIGDSPKCKRTQFAVYLGLSSGVLAIAMFALNQAPFHCQGIVSFLLTAAWCCGVSYITFGEGPGTSMGNVYFATWACLFLGLNLTTTAVKHAMGAKDDDKDDGSVKKEKKSAAEEEEKSDEEDDGAEP